MKNNSEKKNFWLERSLSNMLSSDWKVIKKYIHKDRYYDRDQAINNFLIVVKIFDKFDIDYRLIFGALLGLYRDNNLIEWDSDIDIFVTEESFKKIIDQNILDIIYNEGFIIRLENDKKKLKLFRDYEKIAINAYFLKNNKYSRPNYSFPEKLLHEHSFFKLKNFQIRVPKDVKKFLVYVYGENWKIPIKSSNEKDYIMSSVRSGGRFGRLLIRLKNLKFI